jgi:hypothetical protein
MLDGIVRLTLMTRGSCAFFCSCLLSLLTPPARGNSALCSIPCFIYPGSVEEPSGGLVDKRPELYPDDNFTGWGFSFACWIPSRFQVSALVPRLVFQHRKLNSPSQKHPDVDDGNSELSIHG